jgi:hypothetical protein
MYSKHNQQYAYQEVKNGDADKKMQFSLPWALLPTDCAKAEPHVSKQPFHCRAIFPLGVRCVPLNSSSMLEINIKELVEL